MAKAAPNPNMRTWTKFEKTPIKHTKKVSIGRGFTAIDAQYCIMRMTEVFGPVGEGWGYSSYTQIITDLRILQCDVTVWHGNRENEFGPYTSLAKLQDKKGNLDTDAAKKAITDSLTKCLSHLGIGADVFLGKYDDNKYIAQLRKDESDSIREQFSVHPPEDEPTPEVEAQDEHLKSIAQEDDL